MRTRRKSLFFSVLFLTAVALAIPYCALAWKYRHEPFYNGLPASYWRKLLAKEPGEGFSLAKWAMPMSSYFGSRSAILSGDPKAKPVLLYVADDPASRVRKSTVWGLKRCCVRGGERDVIPILGKFLMDPNEEVRTMAIYALGDCYTRGAPCLGWLIEALNDPSGANRCIAVSQIRMGGLRSAEALPALRKCQTDSWLIVRQEARQSIEDIERSVKQARGVAQK